MEHAKKISGYTINFDKKLGEGSYGKVYVGQDDVTHTKVAIKILDRDQIDNDQYLRNAVFYQVDILKSLNSPHVVQFKNLIESDHYYYIIQQLCDGGNLGKLIEKRAPIPQAEAIQYLTQMTNGFLDLVKQGVVHRDLKPDNVFIHKGQLKIADFGFSKKLNNKRVKNVSMVGTPLYMSLEILKGKPYTSKCDIWALGLIFYQLLFKRNAWDANTEYQLITNIQQIPLSFPKNIGNLTKDFLQRVLALQQKNRLSWDEVFKHDIFKGAFSGYVQKQSELQIRLKEIMNKIKFGFTKNNINFQKIFKHLGFEKNQELKYDQFAKVIITSGAQNLGPQQLKYMFQKIDINDSNSISFGQLIQSLNKFGISTNAQFKNNIIRSPSANHVDGPSKNEILNNKIKKCFKIILNYCKENNMLLQTIFNKNRKTFQQGLSVDELGKLLNSFGNIFQNQQINFVAKRLQSIIKNIPIIQYKSFQSYFCKVNSLSPNICVKPKNSNFIQLTNFVNIQPQMYQQSPYNQSPRHGQSPMKYVQQQVQSPYVQSPQINQKSTFSNYMSKQSFEGPQIIWNNNLGVYTQIYDQKYHKTKKGGILGFFS